MKACLGIALVTVLASGCGGGSESSQAEQNGVGTRAQAVSSTFNGCTFSTEVPTQIVPSIYPEWNADVDAAASYQCDSSGNIAALHNIQVWNTQWNDWDNYHVYGGNQPPYTAGTLVSFHNRNWLEARCYRSSMAIQKLDANMNLVWRSPTIYSAAVSLGAPCPDGSGATPPPTTYALTLTATGRSGEKVTSTPAGLVVSVGSSGTVNYSVGSSIKLTPSNGRSAIWSGACSSGGAKTSSCTFTLNANSAVTANVQ